ncbi:SUMF1/EgtB/PvdO family nonheme iron enzyme [bacterium]|nr:SUMF1/EgtB/PvdO family nonheme iron enzyme [bacterium]
MTVSSRGGWPMRPSNAFRSTATRYRLTVLLATLLFAPFALLSQQPADTARMIDTATVTQTDPETATSVELEADRTVSIVLHTPGDSIHRNLSALLEDYRTLVQAGDLSGLREMFRDSALIVVGHVSRTGGSRPTESYATWGSYRRPTVEVTTERKNPQLYLERLGEILDAAKDLSVRFDSIRVMSFPLYPDWFGATVYQHWNSDFYDDNGWLFVLFETGSWSDAKIVVRAWQSVPFKQNQILGFLDQYAQIAASLPPEEKPVAPPAAGDERWFPLHIGSDSIDPVDSLLMVFIEPGTFTLGADGDDRDAQNDEFPAVNVRIEQPFWIGKYELTQRQWRAVTGMNPSVQKGDSLPVTNISWFDMDNLLLDLLHTSVDTLWRLPSEREWEYACRAGLQTPFSWGRDEEYRNASAYGWYGANSDSSVHPVGKKLPNAWGLFDMHGNVYEWCADEWSLRHDTTLTTHEAWADTSSSPFRVTRGGDWSMPARFMRSSNRARQYADRRSPFIGVRLARTVEPDTTATPLAGKGQEEEGEETALRD